MWCSWRCLTAFVLVSRWERAGAGCGARSAGIHQWGEWSCLITLGRFKRPLWYFIQLRRLSISGRSTTAGICSWRGLLKVLQPERFSESGDCFLLVEDLLGLVSALLILYIRTGFLLHLWVAGKLCEDRGGSLGLVADPAACSCIFWWEKLPLSGCRSLSFFFFFPPPPTQYSHLLLFQRGITSATSRKIFMFSLFSLFPSLLKAKGWATSNWITAVFSLS